LWTQFDHVSVERAVSGPGLASLHMALCQLDGAAAPTHQAAEIAEHGLAGSCAQCVESLHMFCSMLGGAARNLVLTLGATQGVYIGGGIVPRLGEFFVRSGFRERFEGRGRYVDYLRAIPAYVIQSTNPAFVGLVQAFNAPGPRLESLG
jgi:glucokinase